VKIGDVAKVKEGTTSDTISKRDGKIYADVTAEVTSDNVTAVSVDVQKNIDRSSCLTTSQSIQAAYPLISKIPLQNSDSRCLRRSLSSTLCL
jgi:multidrug efflux pump subunit AcrB